MCLFFSVQPLVQLLPWWILRYVSLHQQILEACSQQLLDLARSSMVQGACVCVCVRTGSSRLPVWFWFWMETDMSHQQL